MQTKEAYDKTTCYEYTESLPADLSVLHHISLMLGWFVI